MAVDVLRRTSVVNRSRTSVPPICFALRMFAQRFFWAAAIAARPAAEMPLRFSDPLGRPGPLLLAPFFCLRFAQ